VTYEASVTAYGNYTVNALLMKSFKSVFLNRWAAALNWALASIIPGHERFSWN